MALLIRAASKRLQKPISQYHSNTHPSRCSSAHVSTQIPAHGISDRFLPPTRLSRAATMSTLNDTFQNPNVKTSPVYDKISFIGTGKMAEALISPLISTQLQPPHTISIHDVSPSTMDRMSTKYGVQQHDTVEDCVESSELIVCAVKPQNCDLVFEQIRSAMEKNANATPHNSENVNATLLSIVAGKPISSLVSGTGLKRVVRCMPNTPATIGKGVTIYTTTPDFTTDDSHKIEQILNSFGKSIRVNDEQQIDMATALSGSGPAYIFLLIESMIDSGVHMGLSRKVSTTLVHETVLGSTLYAMEKEKTSDEVTHPSVLRNSVTSPNGTTASALYTLEQGNFRTVIADAVWSCYRRSLEMGGMDSNVGPGRTRK